MKKLLTHVHGQDLAEYALLLGGIALVVLIAVTTFGDALHDVFQHVADETVNMKPHTTPAAPPDCYGSVLLPIMVAVSGAAATVSRWRRRRELA